MIKNVPKRHFNIENLKCFMTMNSFQVLIMLRKFNIKAFILEIITITKCFAWFSSLQNVLNNIITINSRWSLWTKNNSSNSSFSWYLKTKNNNKSNSYFFGKDIISNTTSIINKNNRINTYSKMLITFNMNFLDKTKKLEINKWKKKLNKNKNHQQLSTRNTRSIVITSFFWARIIELEIKSQINSTQS
jgi:hypothetical protein